MHKFKKYNQGFTFVEVVIAIAILILFTVGVYRGYRAVYDALAAAHHKALAVDLVNERFEIIKNLPYASVGTVGGVPVGVITPVQNTTRDNVAFRITTAIVNVDDPFDGVAPADAFPRDYKLVELKVECVTCRMSPVTITGRVAPTNLES